jgi:serine/threonine-protein kinase
VSGVPAKVGRYEVRRELGRGMMGVVYEAHDSLLDRVVALKTIHLSFQVSEAERRNFEERFLTEARSAARLSHPGIVVVHDVGRDPETGTLFMALEHLKGRPLSALYGEGSPMEWREGLRIVGRVAEALHHAHAAGVVHRDIKPANIMVLDSGDPKVMDFGLAKLQKSQLSLTSSGQFFGTPLYMSPEQALGKTLDGRSDLFSLGSVAYALVTGRAPFAGDNIPQIFLKVAQQNAALPSLLNPALPPGVDEIITRAMAKDPVDRYRDGRSMAEGVEDVLAGRLPQLGSRASGVASPEAIREPLQPAPVETPGNLDGDLDAAFSTLAPGGSPTRGSARPAPVLRSSPPPRGGRPAASGTRAVPAGGGPGGHPAWATRALVGLGLLLAGMLAGTLVMRGGPSPAAPVPDPEADAAPPTSEAATALEPDLAPIPTTLTPDDARRLAQAVAARLSGDLELSRQILQRLVGSDPGNSAATELLGQVEAELWAREALPLEFRAQHNHRIGSCTGQLTLEATGVSYSSPDHGLWRWSFDELERMTRKGRRELELVTGEKETLRLGGGKHYDFKLTSDTVTIEDWARFVRFGRGR